MPLFITGILSRTSAFRSRMLSLLKPPLVYVQLSARQIRLRDPRSGHTLAEPSLVALTRDAKPRIIAVGAQARLAAAQDASIRLYRPLEHPRTQIADFVLAEQLLKQLLRQALKRRWWSPSPMLVMHALDHPEGGLSQIEERALRELGQAAGASATHVVQGIELSDEQLLAGAWRSAGQAA